MNVLTMGIYASILIAVILLIRALALYRIPKWAFSALWGITVIRLLIPFHIPIGISVPVQASAVPGPILQEHIPSLMEAFPDQVIMLWGLVGAVLFVVFAVRYLRGYQKLSTSLPCAHPAAQEWLQTHKLMRTIQVRVSDQITQPLTYGVIKPVIVLPKKFDWNDSEKLSYILSHEFSHIKRFDAGMKMLLALALCVHWFNPLVWAMYFCANRDMELACDHSVIRKMSATQKAVYANTLLAFSHKPIQGVPLFSGFSRYAISERIVAITKAKKCAAVGIIGAILVTMAVTFSFLSFSIAPYVPGLSAGPPDNVNALLVDPGR